VAIASGGTLGTGTSSTSGTSFTLTTATNTLAAGNAALRVAPWDIGAFEFVANDAPRSISYYYRTLGAT